jgi:hypothetical protein
MDELNEVLTEEESTPEVDFAQSDFIDEIYAQLPQDKKTQLEDLVTPADIEKYVRTNLLPKALLAYEYLLKCYDNPKLLKDVADRITDLAQGGKKSEGGVGVAINIDKNFFDGVKNGLEKVAENG